MDELQILSNKNGNFSWWRRGPADETLPELRAPSAYLELQSKQFFSTTQPGLFLFSTQAGQSCCLLCGIASGLISGIVVQDSILIVGKNESITLAMRGLASLYLADPPVPAETAALEIDPPPSLAELLALIQKQGRDVQVRWGELGARLQGAARVSSGPTEGRFLHRDTAVARKHLAELIARTSSVPTGEVLAAVSDGLSAGQLARYGIRWALSGEDAQTLEAPLEKPAVTLSSEAGFETTSRSGFEPVSRTESSPPALEERQKRRDWLVWAFYASLLLAGVAAAISIGWKRR